MGFRRSRVRIPPSRLLEDEALQRLSLWGFFLVKPHVVSFVVSFSTSATGQALRGVEHNLTNRLGIGMLV